MPHRNILVSACIAIALPLASHAQTAFQATLTDHAVLPAQTMIAAPQDAPAHLQTSGKFTTGKRVEKLAASRACLLIARPACSCLLRVNRFKVIQALNACQTALFGC